MAAHIHAELINEVAKLSLTTDKPWLRVFCRKQDETKWIPLKAMPSWRTDFEYKILPEPININGFDVPHPVSKRLENGKDYYVTKIDHRDIRGNTYEWTDSDIDFSRLNSGLIHLEEESAILHGKSLLSFTLK